MTTRVNSTLNPNALGPGLVLDYGNVVVSTNAGALDIHRKVLGRIPKGVGISYFEFWHYSNLQGNLANLVAVGIAQQDAPLDTAVGEDATSWGFQLTEGVTRNNNATVDTYQPVAERTCVGVLLVNDPMSPTVSWYVNGSLLGTNAIAAGKFWVPAISIGTDADGAGGLKAFVNFGQRPFEHPIIVAPSTMFEQIYTAGWYEILTEGLSTIYLSITDEGIVTASTDDPPSKVYKARLLNPEQFSIKRAPLVWPLGDTSVQLAAFGQLQLDNYDGFFDYLVGADLKDTEVIIKLPRAQAFGSETAIQDAFLICTAIIDDVKADNEDVITITLKDTLARLDRPLPVRYNPPFVDSGAANRMIPISLGAIRNTAPLLIDQTQRLYQLHDSNIANVAAVRDKAAALDPHASPPQYAPALNGSGIQLDTLPAGKLTVDMSSTGTQAVIPGIEDVLGGDGDFATWSGSPSAPNNWTWSDNPGSTIIQKGTPTYPADYCAYLLSAITWYPPDGKYGDQLQTDTNVLEAGKSYRVTFKVYLTIGSAPYYFDGLLGGIMVRSALDNFPESAISPHGQTITVPILGDSSYVYEFTVPAGADRPLIFLAIASQGGPNIGTPVGTGGGVIYDIKLELLGEYLELPLTGMSLEDYYTEILVKRAGEPSTIFNVADLTDIGLRDDGTVIPFGVHADDQPNILDMLRAPSDSFCITNHTDATGTIRTRQFGDPKLGTPICDFSPVNVDRPISFRSEPASNLTTLIGARRNQSVFSDADFVSDQLIVPQDIKTRYMRTSQFQRTSGVTPSGEYSFAIGAPIFDSLLDDASDAQNEIDRVVQIFGPQIYDDGTISSGKRKRVNFTARFDDPEAIGDTIQCVVTDIMFASVVLLTYAAGNGNFRFENTPVAVMEWTLFPFGKKLQIDGLY